MDGKKKEHETPPDVPCLAICKNLELAQAPAHQPDAQ
jgi:hypothetical protein